MCLEGALGLPPLATSKQGRAWWAVLTGACGRGRWGGGPIRILRVNSRRVAAEVVAEVALSGRYDCAGAVVEAVWSARGTEAKATLQWS